MKLRECRGEINRARTVLVWVEIDSDHEHGGMWCELSKVSARRIVDHCQREGISEINARVGGKKTLMISELDSEPIIGEPEPEAEAAEETEAAECDGEGCSCAEHDGEECTDDSCACPAGHDDEDE